jgi:predicted kinase
MPNCFILRGLPGSGKSTMSGILIANVVSADFYFMKDGVYLFDKSKLNDAHKQCKEKFIYYVDRGHDVVVDNTNTKRWQYAWYKTYAEEHGYKVHILRIETDLSDE